MILNHEYLSQKRAKQESERQSQPLKVLQESENKEDDEYTEVIDEVFTPSQLEGLEKEFQRTQYPDIYVRARLSRQLDINVHNIEVWLLNRRAKWRQEQRSEAMKQSQK